MANAKRPQPLTRPNFITRLHSYGRDHLRGMVFSLGKLYRQPFATHTHIINDSRGTSIAR